MSVCTGFGAGGLPVSMQLDRQAVQRGDAVPGGACGRDGGWHAQAAAHDGDGRGGGVALGQRLDAALFPPAAIGPDRQTQRRPPSGFEHFAEDAGHQVLPRCPRC